MLCNNLFFHNLAWHVGLAINSEVMFTSSLSISCVIDKAKPIYMHSLLTDQADWLHNEVWTSRPSKVTTDARSRSKFTYFHNFPLCSGRVSGQPTVLWQHFFYWMQHLPAMFLSFPFSLHAATMFMGNIKIREIQCITHPR